MLSEPRARLAMIEARFGTGFAVQDRTRSHSTRSRTRRGRASSAPPGSSHPPSIVPGQHGCDHRHGRRPRWATSGCTMHGTSTTTLGRDGRFPRPRHVCHRRRTRHPPPKRERRSAAPTRQLSGSTPPTLDLSGRPSACRSRRTERRPTRQGWRSGGRHSAGRPESWRSAAGNEFHPAGWARSIGTRSPDPPDHTPIAKSGPPKEGTDCPLL